MEISSGSVCLMGMGIVFVGLLCIIFLVKLMNAICDQISKKKPAQAESSTKVSENHDIPSVNSAEPIANREELIAAVCAAAAEELGTSVSALRVLSFKKIR